MNDYRRNLKNFFPRSENVLGLGGFGLWLLQVIFYVLPPLPSLFIFANKNIMLSWALYLEKIIVVLLLLLSIVTVTKYKNVRLSLKWLLLMAAWFPAILLMFSLACSPFYQAYWVIPLLLPTLILTRRVRRTKVRSVLELLLAGLVAFLICLLHGVDPLLYYFLAPMFLVIVLAGYNLKKYSHLLVHQYFYLPLLCAFGTMFIISVHAYIGQDRTPLEKITSQPGVTALSLINQAGVPLGEITSFFQNGDETFIVPHNANYLYRYISPTDIFRVKCHMRVGDRIATDCVDNRLFFTGGYVLYKGLFGEKEPIKPVVSLIDQMKIVVVDSGSDVNLYPSETDKKLLIQYDLAYGVIIFNLTSETVQQLPTINPLIDSIWHPSGNKLVIGSILKGRHLLPKSSLDLVDLEGNVYVRKPLSSLFFYLGQAEQPYFFLTHFLERKIDVVSYDTLETLKTIPTAPTPRANKYLPKWNCFVVSSFTSGKLTFYDTVTLKPIKELIIGIRVRAITSSCDCRTLFISSASGYFKIDLNVVLGKDRFRQGS